MNLGTLIQISSIKFSLFKKTKGILNKPLKVLSSKLELLVNLNVFQRVTHELLQEHVTQCIGVWRERFHRERVLVFHAHLSEWKFFFSVV